MSVWFLLLAVNSHEQWKNKRGMFQLPIASGPLIPEPVFIVCDGLSFYAALHGISGLFDVGVIFTAGSAKTRRACFSCQLLLAL